MSPRLLLKSDTSVTRGHLLPAADVNAGTILSTMVSSVDDFRRIHPPAMDTTTQKRYFILLMTHSFKLSFVVLLMMFCTDVALSQVRTFTERPQVLLGLRTDRSPFISFVDVDGDGDMDDLILCLRIETDRLILST